MRMELIKVVSSHEVVDFLLEHGVTYDRVVVDHWLEKRWCAGIREVEGIHHYFMLGNCDVAYYTPGIKVLCIHRTPRPWSDEFLEQTKDITHRYPAPEVSEPVAVHEPRTEPEMEPELEREMGPAPEPELNAEQHVAVAIEHLRKAREHLKAAGRSEPRTRSGGLSRARRARSDTPSAGTCWIRCARRPADAGRGRDAARPLHGGLGGRKQGTQGVSPASETGPRRSLRAQFPFGTACVPPVGQAGGRDTSGLRLRETRRWQTSGTGSARF